MTDESLSLDEPKFLMNSYDNGEALYNVPETWEEEHMET